MYMWTEAQLGDGYFDVHAETGTLSVHDVAGNDQSISNKSYMWRIKAICGKMCVDKRIVRRWIFGSHTQNSGTSSVHSVAGNRAWKRSVDIQL